VAKSLNIAVEFYDCWMDGEELDKLVESFKPNLPDVLISRGGMAAYLAQTYPFPVVPVNTSAYDILECLDEARKYSSNIAITSFGEPLPGLPLMEKVLGVAITEINSSTLDMTALKRRISLLASTGEFCVVGGGPSVSFAKECGLPSVFLRTNTATIQAAFQTADHLALLRHEERRKSEMINAILDNTYEGIIAINSTGQVEVFNKAAGKIMNKSPKDIIGKLAVEVIPRTRLHLVLKSASTELGEIQDIGHTRIVTNRIPISYDEKTMGAVATFQELNKIVQTEQKIRKEISGRNQFRARAKFTDIIGQSAAIMAKKKLAAQFATSDSTVLLYGESGTGKELFAQSIHNASHRSANPFVPINCGALPPTLLESELFGYEEGAFTGARGKGKYGLFELAHSGTIFLDEINELPLDMQGRLLRVLQEREVLRVGGERIIPIDVRVIAATNIRPEELMGKRQLREDLFYRINVLYLEIPPLAKRKEDLEMLCQHFLPVNSGERTKRLLEKMLPYFQQYSWPGNVRELQNVIQRISLLADSISAEDDVLTCLESLTPNIIKATDFSKKPDIGKVKMQKQLLERDMILKAVEEHRTLEDAATYLGMGRSTLTRKLKEIRRT